MEIASTAEYELENERILLGRETETDTDGNFFTNRLLIAFLEIKKKYIFTRTRIIIKEVPH